MSKQDGAEGRSLEEGPIVVVGGGQAGQSWIEALRGAGYEGRLVLIGEEPIQPYQRPPLSKKYLLGEMALERLFFRPPNYYRDMEVETRWGTRLTGIDPNAKSITLDGDESLVYAKLGLATGARPRLLPEAIGGAAPGVYPARTIADIDAMTSEFIEGRRVAVIGGGYIGLEAAAVAAQRGLKVTVVEMAARLLSRVAPPETAAYFHALHTNHGVDIRCGVGLERFELGPNGRVARAVLSDGTALEVDFVLVGVGVSPNVEAAESAGLAVENGIVVDAQGRTSDPHIYAAGDCAFFPYGEGRIRLESVQNAIDQAAVAACAMMGAGETYAPTPWFWSDQYNVKLQIAGLSTGVDHVVTRPGRTPESQSVWCFQGERLLAVDAMNDPRAYMTAKRWLEAGVSPDPARVADPEADLKTLI
ncbi:MAG: FAD-dependent oxidoreductase [Rhodobacteraceae bacterium]|nr:FAD-dependent oxidoreductase [Paracoccaceae bacterium]